MPARDRAGLSASGSPARLPLPVTAAGGRSLPVVADMLYEAQVMTAVDVALEAFGRLDVVQNDVGGVCLGGPEELTLASGAQPCRSTWTALSWERRRRCRTW
jgi:NAD(P)-dependent dehydrogenase (short-subunit alcohol dehydrogenase family)